VPCFRTALLEVDVNHPESAAVNTTRSFNFLKRGVHNALTREKANKRRKLVRRPASVNHRSRFRVAAGLPDRVLQNLIGASPRHPPDTTIQNLTIPCRRVLWCRSAEPTISSSLKAVRLNRAGLSVESSQTRPLCHASCVSGLWFATPGCQ
jgi:hypothetical protein